MSIREKNETVDQNGQADSQLAQNPNPRANENLPTQATEGGGEQEVSSANEVGTEVTDGEDG